MQLSFCSRVLLPLPGLQISALIQVFRRTDSAVIAHFLICQEANGVSVFGGGGGGGGFRQS